MIHGSDDKGKGGQGKTRTREIYPGKESVLLFGYIFVTLGFQVILILFTDIPLVFRFLL